MAKNQIILRSGPTVSRRQPLLRPSTSSGSRERLVEMAGGAAAECAAVWCCCPCTVVNLLAFAVYKVPAGICRKALKQRRRKRMMKKGLVPFPSSSSASTHHHHRCKCGWDSAEFHAALDAVPDGEEVAMVAVGGSEMDKELMELEKEIWDTFYSTGFWRSPSQRES